MKKILFLIVMLFSFSFIAQAVTWTVQIVEITKPSLKEIRVEVLLKADGKNYVTDYVTISPSELKGLTKIQKINLIKSRIKEKCSPYIETYNVAQGLETLKGEEISAQ